MVFVGICNNLMQSMIQKKHMIKRRNLVDKHAISSFSICVSHIKGAFNIKH